MKQHKLVAKLVAALLVVTLQAIMTPIPAADSTARLHGAVVRVADHAPVPGVKVHVGDPKSGRIVTAGPTATDGTFHLAGLAPATYELAVEADGGLYVVQSPVQLAPGQSQSVHVAVPARDDAAADDDDLVAGPAASKPSLWSNPLTAALIVLGAAIVVGFAVDQATEDDDEEPASPAN